MPGSLILPRTKYEAVILVGEVEQKPFAVFLGIEHRFRGFSSVGNNAWRGIIVPNVQIEVDPFSAKDADDSALGTIVRTGSDLMIRTRADHWAISVSLRSGLAVADDVAGFTKWRVVLGQGDQRRVLHQIDLEA